MARVRKVVWRTQVLDCHTGMTRLPLQVNDLDEAVGEAAFRGSP